MLFSILALVLPLAVSLTGALESVKRLALVLVGFSGIIFVHELGHFIVARLCSVRCDVFSIGIGPRMLGWKKGIGFSIGKSPEDRKPKSTASDGTTVGETGDENLASKSVDRARTEEETVAGAARGAASFGDLEQTSAAPTTSGGTLGETDYRVSWLPLGGYVRMLGQDDMDPTKISSDPRSFNRRPIWQRMCIVSAGVVMNVITAAVIFSVIFHPRIGVKFPPAVVGEVQYNSPAALAGMQPGYRIEKIDDEKGLGYVEFMDLMIASALSRGVDPVKFEVRRPDGTVETIAVKPGKIPGVRFLAIGVSPLPSTQLVSIATDDEWNEWMKDVKNGHLLKRGDHIVSINGVELKDPTPESESYDGGYVLMNRVLQESRGKDVTVVVENKEKRAGRETITLTPKFTTREIVGQAPGILGMYPRVMVNAVNKGSAAEKGGMKKGDIIEQVASAEHDVPNVEEFRSAVSGSAGREISITVLRDGKPEVLAITPTKAKDDDGKTVGRIGVELAADFDHAVVTSRDEDPRFPAESFRGAAIAEINGEKVSSWGDVFSLCRTMNSAQTLKIKMTLKDKTEKTFDLALNSDARKLDPLIASVASPVPAYKYWLSVPVENLMWTQRASAAGGVGEAMQMGMQHTWKFMQQTYLTLRGLFIGTVSAKELHGIVGIAKVGYDVQDRGLTHLWFILAVVSVNLAVANFLPLPIVDGGLFLLLILEKIRGRPLSLKVQSAIQIVGIVALAGLFLFVTYNDILFVGWGK